MVNSLKKIWNRLSRSYLLLYTASFAVCSFAVFYYFISTKTSFVWNPDSTAQHFASFVYLGKYLREFATNILHGSFVLPQWDFSIGLGADIVTSLHYYAFGDPLDLLSAIIPSRYAAYGYTLLMALRYYLAGLAFVALCKYKKHPAGGAVAASLFYIFNLYSMDLALRHPSFLNPFIYFPLIILGIEMMFDKKKPYLFIFMIFTSAISSFYFFYVISMFTVLYIFIRLFFEYKEHFIKNCFGAFFKFGGSYLLGVLMAAVVFVPVVSVFLGSARGGVAYELTAFYKPEFYKQFITSFASPLTPYTNNYLGYTVLAIIGVLVLFSRRRKDKESKFLKTAFIILTIFMMLPVVSKVANGFSYVTNRWSWIYGLLVAYIFSAEFREMKALRFRQLVLLYAGSLGFFAYTLLQPFTNNIQNIICAALFLAIVTGYFAYWALSRVKENKIAPYLSRTFKYFVIAVTIVAVFTNSYYIYSPDATKYKSEFMSFKSASSFAAKNGYKPMQKIQNTDTAVERYSVQRIINDLGDLNNAMLIGGHGTTSYLSLTDGRMNMFNKELGLVSNNFSILEGPEGDPFVNTALNVRYFATLKNNPADFGISEESLGQISSSACSLKNQKFDVHENMNYVPFGFGMKNVISQEEYDALTQAEKRVMLANALVVNDTDEFVNSNADEIKAKCTSVPFTLEAADKHSYIDEKDNQIYISEEKTLVKIKAETIPGTQVYCLFKNLRYVPLPGAEMKIAVADQTDDFSPERRATFDYLKTQQRLPRNRWVDVYGNDKQFSMNLTEPSYDYYSGITDLAANLGYSESGFNEITLKLNLGLYEYDEIEVVCVDMNSFADDCDALAEDVIQNLKLEPNRVSGEFTASEDEMLYLSIPYSKYWTATVDGEKAEVYCANTAFTALHIAEGTHTVELKYSNTMLKYSAVLSAIGFAAFIGVIVYNEKKKKSE